VSFGLFALTSLEDRDGLDRPPWRSLSPGAASRRPDDNVDMKSLIDNFRLSDPDLLDPVREFAQYTVVMTTLWPNLIIQQQSNTWRCASSSRAGRTPSSWPGPSSATPTTTRR